MNNRSRNVAPMQAVAGNTRSRGAFRDVTNENRRMNAGNGKMVAGQKRGAESIVSDTYLPSRQRSRVAIEQTGSFDNSSSGAILPVRQVSLPRKIPVVSKAIVQRGVDDIDQRDADDPLYVTGYVQDMYEHFRAKEASTSVRPVYMETQTHINQRMRSILVDWLVEVHLKFRLVPETLYLTVNLIDRYLERQIVPRNKLQLVGVTSLLLASKYEEIYPPELRDLVYICDRAYAKSEILAMEERILKTLEYDVTIPSAHCFLIRFLKAGHADKRIVQLSCFILDGTLQSLPLHEYLPSQLAAAAVFIARRTLGRNNWSPTLLHYSNYTENDIAPVARAVLKEKERNGGADDDLNAVHKKYSSSKYGGVAHFPLINDF